MSAMHVAQQSKFLRARHEAAHSGTSYLVSNYLSERCHRASTIDCFKESLIKNRRATA